MRILIADQMEDEVVKDLKSLGEVINKPADLNSAIADAEILIVRSATQVTKELLSKAKKLKIVARAGVGLDNIDKAACDAKGIKVVNTPGASTNAVAELTIGMIIGALRFLPKAHLQMKSGKWEKKSLVGMEMESKILGIVGYGRIGTAVASKARALGMKIISYNPPPRFDDPAANYIEKLDDFLPKADIITIHAALTDKTKNIINKSTIAKMKDGVVLINAARGEMIDEEALYEACKSGKVAAAALDVYTSEPYKGKLLTLENVYLTPHIGASTKEAQRRIGTELVRLLREAQGRSRA